MIITARRIAVPDVSAPIRSAIAASAPIANPPMMVSGRMYLFNIDSKTLWSCRKPGIWRPEDMIFLAWLDSSIPDVFTQNTAKIAEKVM